MGVGVKWRVDFTVDVMTASIRVRRWADRAAIMRFYNEEMKRKLNFSKKLVKGE